MGGNADIVSGPPRILDRQAALAALRQMLDWCSATPAVVKHEIVSIESDHPLVRARSERCLLPPPRHGRLLTPVEYWGLQELQRRLRRRGLRLAMESVDPTETGEARRRVLRMVEGQPGA